MMNIHPHFQLNRQTFRSVDELLHHVQNLFPSDYPFLRELFDDKDYIKVKTSGSTGKPKSIKLPKKALLKSAEATGIFFDLKERAKMLHCLSSEFIAGKMMWVRALHLGCYLDRVEVSSHPLKNSKDTYDFAAMVPLQVQESFENLYLIKTLIIGGAPLSEVWEQKLANHSCNAYATYGMTETITHIAVRHIGKEKTYQTLPSFQISVDNRECLKIDAPHLPNTPIQTNDVVKLIDKQSFQWLGRYDHVINTGGYKVFPESVEQELSAFIDKTFIIFGLPDKRLGEKVVLLIEGKPYDFFIKTDFQQADLHPYEIPKEVLFLSKFVRTPNGKINRTDTILKINKKIL